VLWKGPYLRGGVPSDAVVSLLPRKWSFLLEESGIPPPFLPFPVVPPPGGLFFFFLLGQALVYGGFLLDVVFPRFRRGLFRPRPSNVFVPLCEVLSTGWSFFKGVNSSVIWIMDRFPFSSGFEEFRCAVSFSGSGAAAFSAFSGGFPRFPGTLSPHRPRPMPISLLVSFQPPPPSLPPSTIPYKPSLVSLGKAACPL